MVKKWVYRILAFALVVFVLAETRKYFNTDVKAYAQAQAEQRAIWDAKGEYARQHQEQKAEEEVKKKEPQTSAEEKQEEQEPEVVYEPSEATGDDFYFDFGQYALMESGEYLIESGEKADHKRRMRYPELVDIDCPEYIITVSEGFSVCICEYDADKNYIRGMRFSEGDKFYPCKQGMFFSVTLIKNEGEKSLSPGQWGKIMAGDFKAIICTEKRMDYSPKELGNLIMPDNTDTFCDLSGLLLSGKDDELSDVLWQEQIKNGKYTLSGEELDNGNVIFFVSSSEGDDRNNGLDAEHPKRSLDAFSGVSGVNILLKCGDVFQISNEFRTGSNVIYAAYGRGKRPILDYYRVLEVSFEKDLEKEDLWVADLSGMDIVSETKNKANCNIGQLKINEEVNWNRLVWSSKVAFDKNNLVDRGEGSWAVNWTESKLYINSSQNPNYMQIEYAPSETAILVKKVHNVVIKGVEIRGAGKHAVNIEDSSDVTVQCCYINHIGGSILVQAGSRYGNALQVWNSGSDICINNNFCSWIFDTCFTNQGTSTDSICENISFCNNIGAHFFWGIESWGETYSTNAYKNIEYSYNILFDNVDITNPTTPMHTDGRGKLLGKSEAEYCSYRNGYSYHQMSSINFSTKGKGDLVNIEGNVVWNSNRFLVLANNDRDEETLSTLKNNLFFSEMYSGKACLMRITNNGKKEYVGSKYLDSSNSWSVHEKSSGYDCVEEKSRLNSMLIEISGGKVY